MKGKRKAKETAKPAALKKHASKTKHNGKSQRQARKGARPMTDQAKGANGAIGAEDLDQARQRDQATTDLAKELAEGNVNRTTKALEGMSADELRDVALALATECRRLKIVETRYNLLMTDLEEESEKGGVSMAQKRRAVAALESRRWTRGKLPGGKLIRTDKASGKFEEVDREEWDRLPAN